jgi:hypothetical protein
MTIRTYCAESECGVVRFTTQKANIEAALSAKRISEEVRLQREQMIVQL